MDKELKKLLEKWIKERQIATTREQAGYTHCINDLETLLRNKNCNCCFGNKKHARYCNSIPRGFEKYEKKCCELCFKWGEKYGEYVFPCNDMACKCHQDSLEQQRADFEAENISKNEK